MRTRPSFDPAGHAAALRLASCAVLALGGFAVSPAPAWSTTADAVASARSQPQRSERQLLEDFIHYVNIARFDLAADLGAELIDRVDSPADFVGVVEASGDVDRFEAAVARARRVRRLEVIASRLGQLYREGKLERARDPEEIAESIELLRTGGTLARTLARDRLVAAGEYAMPQLLEAFLQDGDTTLRARSRGVLIDMGRQAVTPLSVAVGALDEPRQLLVIEVLSRLGYASAAPYLAAIADETASDRVRDSARAAAERLGGPGTATDTRFAGLAEDYFDERSELTSFPGESHQLLWRFDPAIGLLMNPIRTPVYHEAMAMRLAERALEIDPARPGTVALWLAANFSREIDTPAGYDNPAYGPDRREAEYYAVAAGPSASKRVLRRGIDRESEQLARRAIAAIRRTAGRTTLLRAGVGGRRPLLDALTYPSRLVRYDAALAIAASQPDASFPGSDRIVPTLAGMVRYAGERFAVALVGESAEAYSQARAALERQGYTVLPQALRGLDDIAGPLAETPGVDLVVIDRSNGEAALETAEQVLEDRRLGVAPVAVFVPPTDEIRVRQRLSGRDNVLVRRSTISTGERREAIELIVERVTGGPLTDAQARGYRMRALAQLRDLAVANNEVLAVEDAARTLVPALTELGPPLRLQVAEVLAHIGRRDAQTALMDAALTSTDLEDRVALLEKVGDSAKRFGGLLPDRQIRRLIELADAPEQRIATAAAAVMGALELEGFRIVPLLLSDEPPASSRADSR